MNKQASDAPAARSGMAVICFLIIIAGQGWLLRKLLFTGSLSSLPAPFYPELLFCLVMAAAIVLCWVRPTGWGGRAGCTAAIVLFLIYAVFNILNYDLFASSYLTGFATEYASTGGALVGLKLVLALIGVTAGIPVAPRMDDREYARRLREKAQMQEAGWAKASARGAQADLDATLTRLKASLSDEEMAALLAQLQETAKHTADGLTPSPDGKEAGSGEAPSPGSGQTSPSDSDETPSSGSEDPAPSAGIAEEWRGWGGGM